MMKQINTKLKVVLLIKVLVMIAETPIFSQQETPEVFVQLGHSDGVSSLSFLQYGKYMVSGGYDGLIKLWDVQSGREIRSLQGHSRSVSSVSVSLDGNWLRQEV